MTIEPIIQEQYDVLSDIQKKYPALTLQARAERGYQYLDPRKFSPADVLALGKIERILKDHITGFARFLNFTLNTKSNEMQLRFEYDWEADNEEYSNLGSFIGAGYLDLKELLNGFKKEKIS